MKEFNTKISVLDEYFKFGEFKNQKMNFSEIINEDTFFINPYYKDMLDFFSIYAGGLITSDKKRTVSVNVLPFSLMCIVKRGRLKIKFDNKHYVLTRNNVFIAETQRTFIATYEDQPIEFYLYLFRGNNLPLYMSRFKSDTDNGVYLTDQINSNYLYNVSDRINYLLSKESVEACFYINKYITDIMTECIYQSMKTGSKDSVLPKHVLKAKEIIDNDYMKSINLQMLSENTGVSKYKLCRDFAKFIGDTPLHYLNGIRITKSKELLRSTELTVNEVARQSGIPNTNHFIVLFKEHENTTPLRYKESMAHYR